MVAPRQAVGRFLYGFAFVVVLPAVLAWWARATAEVVPLTIVHAPVVGTVIAGAGILLLISGWIALAVHGRGLPMNAFPPQRLVTEGIYRWIRDPIYIGFGLACAGVAIAVGSASGLWLVASTVALASAALTFGFERPDLLRRFGPAAVAPPRLSLPRGDAEAPTWSHRAAMFLWVLLPWVLTWFAAQAVGRAPDVFETTLPFERSWPVWQWTQLLYVSAYLFVPLTVVLAATQRSLRRLALSGGTATVFITLCWFTIPVIAPTRDFVPAHALGELLAFEQRASVEVAAFPAFHVLWVLLCARAWTDDAGFLGQRARAWIGWTWAWLVTASCLTTGMHTVIEVGSALLLYPVFREPTETWAWIRAKTETVANGWREWRFGPVRIINHGAFAAAAAGVGFTMIAIGLPPDETWVVGTIAACTIVGAGIWAQILEGSSVLLRPFGWYGGALGATAGVLIAGALGADFPGSFAAVAIAAPWIQALGRLRCLVQGCCHGGPAPEWAGVRYRHPRSRVTQIAHLGGQPIHATPLYSIAGNLVIGVILLRLRFLGAADTLVIGLYLILGGIARFVEEGARAEPQTPVLRGLHSYQWIAIASVAAGMIVTSLPVEAASTGFWPVTSEILGGAFVAALVTGAAMGVDFPASNRRFSRLASG